MLSKRTQESGYNDENFPSAWPSEVIDLPLSSYTVVDVDFDSDERPTGANAVIQTDRGAQWFFVEAVSKADEEFVADHSDEDHVKLSRQRGCWSTRVFSKRTPHVRRTMLGLTVPGEKLAAEWNFIARGCGDFQKPKEI